MKSNFRLHFTSFLKCSVLIIKRRQSLLSMNMIRQSKKVIRKSFMRNFFSGAFKDNGNLSYGFLTGILRVAQKSIFSGLNNLTVNSIMDNEYDGYFFGKKEIYNPWSVINYFSKGCLPQAYWVHTGKNEILEDVLKMATDDIIEKLYSLLQGERVIARVDQNGVYRVLLEEPANIYSLLLVAGYLKTPKKKLQDGIEDCYI
ncbi:Predicted AAA-ATPase [Lachnospiraceae bacterium XBB1006]|nr:Predicted AAA-ATPase [Lachnospiraceae bacterium XBB1006]